MTQRQIDLVQKSFQQVVPIAESAAALFYNKLFVIDPSLKAMFKSNLEEQGKKLVQALSFAVASLTKLEILIPALENLGRNHKNYGVKDKDYQTVGEALIWTLEIGLGNSFTNEVKEAWLEAYSIIADVMKNAANKAAA